MKSSLQRQLSRSIAGAVLLFGLLAAFLSFWSAFEEAQERQDDTLRQIALLTDAPHLPLGGGRVMDTADQDPDGRIIVERLPAPHLANALLDLPAGLTPGFHTLRLAQGWWRVYVRESASGIFIATAQDTFSRNEVALGGALLTLLPLLALIPLLSWLVSRIIRRGLQPVRALAHRINAQTPGHPAPLPEAQMPAEIQPFIRSINDLLARVRHLLLQRQRFIADAAHELRTPLTALSLQAENLQNADSVESVRRRMIPLRGGIARARRLVDQLLHLSRQRAASGEASTIPLRAMVQDLTDELLPAAESARITLRLVSDGDPQVHAEPYPLRQLLRNLMENAVRYSHRNGEVIIRIGEGEVEAWVHIIDSGPGIPQDERARVFEPFYRIAGTEGEGSGLGLAIAREAAERLGGHLSLADRADGPGTVFTYSHPVQPSPHAAHATPLGCSQ